MTSPMLTVKSLSFAYERRRIVDLWNEDFDAGLCWLRGPNGVGKSTRLKLLAGAHAPQYGTAVLNGIDLMADPVAYRREVAWVSAEPPPFEHLSPAELFGFLSGLYPRADRRRWESHIDGFGLAPFMKQPLRHLSTGTQHKAALAAALALNTTLLLLDEPLNALDDKSLIHWRACMAEAAQARGRLMLLVSHEELGVEPTRTLTLSLAGHAA
jgi:ABC-2 type transport system ATP-binding protein